MRTIVFEYGARGRWEEAEEMIQKVYKDNEEVGAKMHESFQNSWTILLRLLMRFPIKENENGDEDGTYTLHLGQDFVKGSFSFWFTFNGKQDFNGGMILHGFEPTYSCELTEKNYPHWSIHT